MTSERYSRTAMFLHWAIALALAFQLALGWRLEDMARGPGLFSAYQLHKSVGITILLLTVARVAIRFLHPRPALPEGARWTQRLASSVHALLYLVMIGGPLTGWAIVSTAKIKVPTLIFGVLPWPHLPLPSSVLDSAELLHEWIAILGIGLFVLHVAGALRHQFIKGEPILSRMIPFARTGAGAMAVVALAGMFAAHAAGWQWPFAAPPQTVEAAVVAPTSPALIAVDPKVPAAENAVEAPKDPALEKPVPPILPILPAEPSTKLDAEATKPEPAKGEPVPLSDWTIAPGGQLRFTASWAAIPVEGRFGSWGGTIRFSPDALDQTNIRITVDLSSANTADSQRDSAIKGSDFFNVAVHPQAVFTATRARALGGNRYTADGTLSLHGVSRPVTLNFTLKIEGKTARVSGTTRLDRTRFGVGSGEYAATDQIGAAVAVNFSFVAGR
jgi:cytochrome b561/polyisoprenoid-binding protein YceI